MGSTKLSVTDPHLQIAWKIAFKLGKDWGEALRHASHDILKALLDLRAVERLSREKVKERLSSLHQISFSRILGNIEESRELLERHYSGFHYTLVRLKYKSLEDVMEKALRILRELI